MSFPAEVGMCVFNLLPLSALMCSVPVVTRETSTLHQSEPGLVDEMQTTQYCHTTLNTLSHPPWPEPRMDHRGVPFMNASAPCKR